MPGGVRRGLWYLQRERVVLTKNDEELGYAVESVDGYIQCVQTVFAQDCYEEVGWFHEEVARRESVNTSRCIEKMLKVKGLRRGMMKSMTVPGAKIPATLVMTLKRTSQEVKFGVETSMLLRSSCSAGCRGGWLVKWNGVFDGVRLGLSTECQR